MTAPRSANFSASRLKVLKAASAWRLKVADTPVCRGHSAPLDYLTECRCTSVGYLIRDDEGAKVLAASIADEGDEMQATGVFVIPTAAVLSVKLLTASSCSGSVPMPKQRQTSRGR